MAIYYFNNTICNLYINVRACVRVILCYRMEHVEGGEKQHMQNGNVTAVLKRIHLSQLNASTVLHRRQLTVLELGESESTFALRAG